MNHIHRLTEENARRACALAAIEEEVRRFAGYLTGPKFQGELNDYIRTHEVHALIERILGMTSPDMPE